MYMDNTFSDYVTNTMQERDINIAELSRRSGIDASQLSRLLNGTRSIMPETIVKLARGLGRPATEVFCKLVGITPAAKDPQYINLQGIYESLDEKDRQTILDLADFLLSK